MSRTFFARAIVALLLGIVFGYAFGKSTAQSAAEARQLTLKQYVADFEHHKQQLLQADYPMPVAIVIVAVMVVGMFGIYELLVLGVDRPLALLDRRKRDVALPGAPPPW